MDRFVSTFTNKIDAKGRVSIPAPFRAVLERDGYAREAPAASTATPRSMLRRSMQAARDLQKRSMGFSRACRTIRTSGMNSLSRSTATSRFSASMATDASSFLKAFAVTPVLETGHFCRPWRQISNVGTPSLRRAAPARTRKGPGTPQTLFGAGSRHRGGDGGTEEHGNDDAARQPAGGRALAEGRRATFPCCFRKCWPRSSRRTAQTYIDGTFGAGGYTRAISRLRRLPRARHRSRPDARRGRRVR